MSTYSVPPRALRGTRTGYTTGSNAAASAKAATIALLTGAFPEQVTITLPIGETATMTPVACSLGADEAYCCMVKDAGDDPDVTHGALICARVRRAPAGPGASSPNAATGISLDGGKGVGRVTLQGLGLEVGAAAINPVPRQQILANVTDAVREAHLDPEAFLATTSLSVEIIVPEGERLAQKTLNPRLGIVGGISILGTSGKVYPYSTAAWRASVVQAVQLAAHHHIEQIVLTTGSRSERFAMQLYPALPKLAFVEMGVFTGAALETCVTRGVKGISIVAMMGKLIKTAQGFMNTHASAANRVEMEFLAQVCRDVQASVDLSEMVLAANTGRHFLELCVQHGDLRPVQRVIELALAQVRNFVTSKGGSAHLEIVLLDFSGNVLGRTQSDTTGPAAAPRDATPLALWLARARDATGGSEALDTWDEAGDAVADNPADET